MTPPPQIVARSVGDAMHRGVIACHPDTSALAVAKMMAAHRIHSVLVVAEDGACTGIVCDTELEYSLASGAPGSLAAKDIAVAPVIVQPTDSLVAALQLMNDHATTHLVVSVGPTNRVVGVLSILDVANAFANGNGS